MKQIYIILLFASAYFIPNTTIIGQTLIVDYTFQNRFEIPKNKHLQDTDAEDRVNYNVINSIEYRLIHSDRESIYYCPDEKTSIFNEEFLEEVQHIGSFKLSDYTTITYKNLEINKLLSREYILRNSYIIEDALMEYDWELLDEKKEIGGFECFLAKTTDTFGFEVFAWFTLDIPIPNGPMNYHGLPGFILEIYSTSFSLVYNGMKVIESNTPIEFNGEGEKVNQKEFMELFNKHYKHLKFDK